MEGLGELGRAVDPVWLAGIVLGYRTCLDWQWIDLVVAAVIPLLRKGYSADVVFQAVVRRCSFSLRDVLRPEYL